MQYMTRQPNPTQRIARQDKTRQDKTWRSIAREQDRQDKTKRQKKTRDERQDEKRLTHDKDKTRTRQA